MDDAAAGRRVLETLLSDAGHMPVCAADGREALERFEKERFDLVLLDLHMPTLDGRTTAAAMRRCERAQGWSRTPIILLTADATVVQSIPTQLGDFDAFLLKPFSGAMLATVIESRRESLALSPVEPPSVELVSSADETLASRRDRILSRLQDNQPLLEELAALFLQQGPSLLDRIEQAISKLDRTNLFAAAHLLRGQLEMLELTTAAAPALRLESGAEEDSAPSLMHVFHELESTWGGIRLELYALVAMKDSDIASEQASDRLTAHDEDDSRHDRQNG